MTLLELNLEKPALVEERVPSTGEAGAAGAAESSDGGRGRGLLVFGVLALAVVAALAVRRLRSSAGANESDESTAETTTDESGRVPAGGRRAARAVGILGSVVGVVALVRKLRANS
mgnify:CR=1 FL=1